MFANLSNALDFQAKGLVLRSERQRILASNIANADTPGFAGRDINFKQAMEKATSQGGAGKDLTLATSQSVLSQVNKTHPQHISIDRRLAGSDLNKSDMDYTVQTQPTMDRNSVDLDRERATFVDNSVRYEATLRFITGSAKTLTSAITGQ
jgi:flagellar basal-body rod protein FlgB